MKKVRAIRLVILNGYEAAVRIAVDCSFPFRRFGPQKLVQDPVKEAQIGLNWVKILCSLAFIFSVACSPTREKQVQGPGDGGGAGSEKASIQSIQAAVLEVKELMKHPRMYNLVMAVDRSGIENFEEIDGVLLHIINPEKYQEKQNGEFVHDNEKVNLLGSWIDDIPLSYESDRPCTAPDKANAMASVTVHSEEARICFSLSEIRKNTDVSTYKPVLMGLWIHELTHMRGYRTGEAEVLQHLFTLAYFSFVPNYHNNESTIFRRLGDDIYFDIEDALEDLYEMTIDDWMDIPPDQLETFDEPNPARARQALGLIRNKMLNYSDIFNEYPSIKICENQDDGDRSRIGESLKLLPRERIREVSLQRLDSSSRFSDELSSRIPEFDNLLKTELRMLISTVSGVEETVCPVQQPSSCPAAEPFEPVPVHRFLSNQFSILKQSLVDAIIASNRDTSELMWAMDLGGLAYEYFEGEMEQLGLDPESVDVNQLFWNYLKLHSHFRQMRLQMVTDQVDVALQSLSNLEAICSDERSMELLLIFRNQVLTLKSALEDINADLPAGPSFSSEQLILVESTLEPDVFPSLERVSYEDLGRLLVMFEVEQELDFEELVVIEGEALVFSAQSTKAFMDSFNLLFEVENF